MISVSFNNCKKVNTNTNLTKLAPFVDAFASIGFPKRQIISQYEFVDLLGKSETRKVDLGIFGQEPVNYKSACFAVHALPNSLDLENVVRSFRSIGASQFFIIDNGTTQRWLNLRSGPQLRESIATKDAPRMILSHKKYWNPETMMRMRSGFQQPMPEQIDFVDLGLIPALEKEASSKIDSLIRRALHFAESYSKPRRLKYDAQDLFRILFKLLTAKLLSDRGVDIEGGINFAKPLETLQAVNRFYKINNNKIIDEPDDLLSQMSSTIGGSFSFKNLSVDTLTYVYENTLVIQNKRKEFGIHSTPSYLADFIIGNLPLRDFPHEKLTLTDPMCGHAIFLIAAMRQFRELLPSSWDGHRRHEFFTRHLHGIEIDAFSCEVARMCLTLADFPQSDGWDIRHDDAFAGNTLKHTVQKSTIVVGNPPFEDILDSKPKIPKPKELLRRVLPSIPIDGLLGIVLPKSFLSGDDYKDERKYLLEKFAILNVTELPEHVFTHATVETCVITAQRSKSRKKTKYFIIDRSSREKFESEFYIPYADDVEQEYFNTIQGGQFIVPIMREIWDYLGKNPRLRDYAKIYKGVEYELGLISNQRADVIKSIPFPNSQPGLWNVADDFQQFTVESREHLSLDRRFWRNKDSQAWQLPWMTPKVIVPASRLSNGHWRFAAVLDREGLIVGRRFYAIWPSPDRLSLELLSAFLNSPIAQAFCFAHSYQQDTRGRIYGKIPLPRLLQHPTALIDDLVRSYIASSNKKQYDLARETLLQIDAEILKLYELPPRLERKLLDFFSGHRRRVPFEFQEYIPSSFESWIPLHIYISKAYRGSTVEDTLQRLPTITELRTIQYLEDLGSEQ
jgi:hypothetical protein